MFAGAEGFAPIAYDSPEINGFVSTTFAGAGDGFDNTDGQYYFDTGSPANHTLVLQFRQSAFRLWYDVRANAGQFTYSVDGGATVTVNAHKTGVGTCQYVYISGLTPNTTHTLTITNLGGLPPNPPAGITASVGAPASGTLAANTYYYVATYVFGGGETVASNVVSAVVDSAGRAASVQVADVGQGAGNTRFYRSTSPTGPFGFMSSTSTGGGGFYSFTDNGSITPTGVNPPVTGTTNLNTSSAGCYTALAPENATGLVWQKYATSGDTINNRFFGQVAAAPFTQSTNGFRYQTSFGLVATSVASPAYTGAPVDASYVGAAKMNPVLAISNLGFNDLTGAASADLPMWTEYVKKFAGVCADAGCPGIVCSGQMPYNAQWPTYGAARFNALKAQALASGLAFVDLFYPVAGPSLAYSGGTGNPHLTKPQYQAQADFLWNNLLGLTT
jgi:hypothetical protein